jgi:hypothetical protein
VRACDRKTKWALSLFFFFLKKSRRRKVVGESEF